MKKILLTNIATFLLICNALSAPMYNIPVSVKQPDGTTLNCFASGDEFHNWLHDKNGFTIIQHPKTGFYVYALQDGDLIKASSYIAGTIDPISVGLSPKVNVSPQLIQKKRADHFERMRLPETTTKSGMIISNPKAKAASSLGNVVIFIQFADDNITTEGKSFYEQIYNNPSQSSLYHYYQEVTSGQQTVNTTFLPVSSTDYVVWYKDSNLRSYYRPYNVSTNTNGYDPNATSGSSSRTYREHLLLKNTIEAVQNQLPTSFNVDGNGDGYVDCVSFIVSGGPDGWNELLWPHMWALYSYDVYIAGKKVYDYTFQLQYTSGGYQLRLGTIAHEMFHVIGAPDLYRYEDQTETPVGAWDIMASTGSTPQQMTAYMKYLYGNWIDQIPTITKTGSYELNKLQSASNNCFKIPSSASHAEFFVVEYRDKTYQYDGVIPGSGLIVYRINSYYGGAGNASGPPDELYIYRPNNNASGLSTAFYSQTAGRTAINSQTNPTPFLSTGVQGGLKISNVGSPGQTITFDVEIDYTFPKVIKHTRLDAISSLGAGTAKSFSAAIKFQAADLAQDVGRDLSKIDLYIESGGGSDVTVKVWKGTVSSAPNQIIYEKNISNELRLGYWTSHTLTQSIKIEANTDYWIGYSMNATGGRPIGCDYGPMVQGKGGWLLWNTTWQQMTELNVNRNLLITGVLVGDATTSTNPIGKLGSSVLKQNYPNPFSTSTTINYTIDKSSKVQLKVFNTIGQQVALLVSDTQQPGDYQVDFAAKNLPSGIYFYNLEVDNGQKQSVTKRMVINR